MVGAQYIIKSRLLSSTVWQKIFNNINDLYSGTVMMSKSDKFTISGFVGATVLVSVLILSTLLVLAFFMYTSVKISTAI